MPIATPSNILFLGDKISPVAKFLSNYGEKVTSFQNPLSPNDVKDFDFLISYGYRHITPLSILLLFPHTKRINLHISLLPWNRGSDPNFWSFLENTPKGVSIHTLEKGLDTGGILLQKEVFFEHTHTLRSSYDRLHLELQNLFFLNWDQLKNSKLTSQKQPKKGSYHRLIDKDIYWNRLPQKWDTPVEELALLKRNIEIEMGINPSLLKHPS